MSRPFRFGVVATPEGGPQRWIATARRAEELGYATLLMPDGLQRPGPGGGVLLSPFPSLAVAASVTERLRVGTFVLASPLRTPMAAAWEAHSLGVLSGGRFDMGIGTGLPSMKASAERIGQPYGDGADRLARLEATIVQLRELDGEARTPVLVAAGGPKARALAGRVADIVTLAAAPLATREEVAASAAEVRSAAGDRAGDIELAMNLFVVGDEVPEWTKGFIGADAATLIEHDSLVMVRGSVAEMCDELQRRRDVLGVSYISCNAAFVEQFAPVVERLTGQ
ncbi:LLM class flavin-dependent oxidoreductase [Pseudonocardia sp. GCM10023141]|uniref:LLM class flavin-dependent oxidoreductase n=1 Tax=Pseudonocardia sp. GCM10023141 TaxID=3252653 RepID=UPI00361E0DEC